MKVFRAIDLFPQVANPRRSSTQARGSILTSPLYRYWWIYGVNFIIYLITSPRIREAYRKFFKDVWKWTFARKDEANNLSENGSDRFWLPLREMQKY